MTQRPAADNTKLRGSIKTPERRNRAARIPDCKFPLIVPMSLFSVDDVRRLSAAGTTQNRALQLQEANDPRETPKHLIGIAQVLREAFAWAVQCDKMQESHAEPASQRRWYEQVALHADRLLEALDLDPDQCRDPTKLVQPWTNPRAIHDFRQTLDRMAGARTDLPDQLDKLSQVAWDERAAETGGDGPDAEGRFQYRARASFLVDRLPRTLALVSELARLEAERFRRRRRGVASQSDLFARELFKFLVIAHEATFGCKPLTRIKSGETIGGSIDWARAVIGHAADGIEACPRPTPFRLTSAEEVSPASQAESLAQSARMAAPYVARFRELADLSDRRVGDLLETGWRDWQKQISTTAR